jgi:hypothetical protein
MTWGGFTWWEIINVAGMHSLRRTAVIEIFENKQDLRLAQAF